MMTLHPKILERDGKKAFAVLPYEEFQKVQEELDAYEDLKDLRAAKAEEGDAPASPLDAVRKELNI
jgi:PHD/YefM family antitoxin component YafN of YafNO toxin-antitoxin module